MTHTGFFYFVKISTLALMNVPVVVIEIISFLASLTVFFQRGVHTYLRLFSIFLFITVIIESTTPSVVEYYKIRMTPIFNYFTAFEFEIYILIIRYIIQSPAIKRVMLYVLWMYPILFLVNVFFIQTDGFHTITYSLGCLLLVAGSIYYFLELFKSTTTVNLVRESAFWICTGLLFYYTCTFTLVGLWNQLHGLPDVIINNVTTIMSILNCLLYSLFAFSYLCRLRFRKSNTSRVDVREHSTDM